MGESLEWKESRPINGSIKNGFSKYRATEKEHKK